MNVHKLVNPSQLNGYSTILTSKGAFFIFLTSKIRLHVHLVLDINLGILGLDIPLLTYIYMYSILYII